MTGKGGVGRRKSQCRSLRPHLMLLKGPRFRLASTCTITSHGSSLPSFPPLPMTHSIPPTATPGDDELRATPARKAGE